MTEEEALKKLRYAWVGAKARCAAKTGRVAARYGDRGIYVCERWAKSFDAFYADVGLPPFKISSLDRIDNDGPYAPGNVRWTTARVQANNRKQRGPWSEKQWAAYRQALADRKVRRK